MHKYKHHLWNEPADNVMLVHKKISMWQCNAVFAEEKINYANTAHHDDNIHAKIKKVKSGQHPTKLNTSKSYYCCMWCILND